MQCPWPNRYGVHVYVANRSMQERYFYNADGEMLFVPQQGAIVLHTECGKFKIKPGEIAVIPRGLKFSVELIEKPKRCVCENYGHPLYLLSAALLVLMVIPTSVTSSTLSPPLKTKKESLNW